MYKAKDATVAITYACNSRCQMCNIWKIQNPPALSVDDFSRLGKNLKYLNISGGEPFLHPQIVEIVKQVKKNNPKTQIIISSNGYATDLIAQKLEEILKIDPKIGLRISIDGKKETHNKIRGLDDIYERAMKTLEASRNLGVKNLGISFTIMDANVDELPFVYDLAQKNKWQMAMALVQNSGIYFAKNDNKISFLDKVEKNLNYVIDKELKTLNPKQWGRAFYDYGLLYYAKTGKRLLKSGAGFDSVFIDPGGEVYPSNLIELKMGNIKKDNLDKIWQSKKAKEVREKIKKEKITESWIICTIRGEMKKNIFKVLFWTFKRRLGLK